MFRLYTPLLLLQLFCLYHNYTNSKEYKWYFLVFFLPFLGSVIYLYFHFANRRNFEKLNDGIEYTFTKNAHLKRLEKELRSADTTTNRLNLADEYLAIGQPNLALEMYNTCLKGVHVDDSDILIKKMTVCYQLEDFEEVISIGQTLGDDKSFRKSSAKMFYALALGQLNKEDQALIEFDKMDVRYSNYQQRYSYAQYLDSLGRETDAKEKLEELLLEIRDMDRMEKRFITNEIKHIEYAFKHGFKRG